MRHETAVVAAFALTACTAVTSVRVTPDELQTLAGMEPNGERRFNPANEPAMVARGDDDLRLLVTPIGPGWERTPSVQQAPWGKLYTLRWGSSITLTPDRGGNLSLPATEVTGAQLKMNRYSGERTALLVWTIVGSIAFAAIVVGVVVLLGNTSLQIAGGG